MWKHQPGVLLICFILGIQGIFPSNSTAQVYAPEAPPFQTFTYFENDSIQLELDLFLPVKNSWAEEMLPATGSDYSAVQPAPLVIYVHGGGFGRGNRGGGHKLAAYLSGNGIACASISYTLYMEDKSFSCDGILSEKIRAIQIAASQLWHATRYLMDRSSEFGIDTTRIFIAGSSAGAETVLHAAFWEREQMQLFQPVLSAGFRYAGVIAGAGAIMDLNLITRENMLPVMMFHGDEDPLVPYNIAAHHFCPPDSPGWLMLFGSRSIARHLEQLGGTCELITYEGGGHSYAGAHFYQDQGPVLNFIEEVLAERGPFVTYGLVKESPDDEQEEGF